jgi:hypothetical protein
MQEVLYITPTRGDLVIPLTADVTTTANVQDNQMYGPLTSSSSSSSSSSSFSVFSLPYLRYIVADPGYDAKKHMDIAKVNNMKVIPKRGLILYAFIKSAFGQAIYSQRKISIEPLIEHIKSIFRIDQLPVCGFHAVSAIVLLSVLLYQLMVNYNFMKNKFNLKSIKYMLRTW